jgi:ABC-type nickel/cobalt efflux system permease component RcnA
MLSLTHIGMAVILALTAIPLVTRTLSGVGQAPLLEALSRGMLGLIGLWFLFRVFRGQGHHRHEGVMVGVIAGLIPCPLTLFAMFLALARGVPEAGLVFALAMMIGVGLTLTAVATLVTLGREWFVGIVSKRGASLQQMTRVLEGLTGAILVAVCVKELWL